MGGGGCMLAQGFASSSMNANPRVDSLGGSAERAGSGGRITELYNTYISYGAYRCCLIAAARRHILHFTRTSQKMTIHMLPVSF